MPTLKEEAQALINTYINKDGGKNSILVSEVKEVFEKLKTILRATDEAITHDSTTELNTGDYRHLTEDEKAAALAVPNHNDTGNLNTGDYQHLTLAEKTYIDSTSNIELIIATKVLLSTDPTIQLLTFTADRSITLPATAAVGKRFMIINNNGYGVPYILTTNYNNGYGNLLISSTNGMEFIYLASGWKFIRSFSVGRNIVIGDAAKAVNNAAALGGVALGSGAIANQSGVAIGDTSLASFVSVGSLSKGGSDTVNIAGTDLTAKVSSVSIGKGALSDSAAVAVGAGANAKKIMSVALGRASVSERFNEFAKDFSVIAKRQVEFHGMQYITSDAVQKDLTLYYDNGTVEYLNIKVNSMLTFDFILNAMTSTGTGFKSMKITGTLARGAGNVFLVAAVTPLLIAETGVYDTTFNTNNWLVSVTANTVNQALKISVTGETGKTINWFVTGVCNENII